MMFEEFKFDQIYFKTFFRAEKPVRYLNECKCTSANISNLIYKFSALENYLSTKLSNGHITSVLTLLF